ncbi:MAG: hypothetical protein R3229_05870 [Alphaproteobacteria bacterium]|nr:hypothetical protein [Alphaproteobacteria bacterium]
MTHLYRIEGDLGLLIEKFDGRMDWRALWEGMLESTKDPGYRTGFDVVSDMTTADLDLGSEDAKRLAEKTIGEPTMKYHRVAVVAPGLLQFGIARMFGMLSDDTDVFSAYRVFTDFSDARAWLGLPEELGLRL